MFRFIVKRILLFIPTLIALSLIAFGLSKCTPGDAVSNQLGGEDSNRNVSGFRQYQQAYAMTAERLGMDRPAFYFNVQPLAYPDTMYRVVQKDRRRVLESLTAQYGNWPHIQDYYRYLEVLDVASLGVKSNYNSDALIEYRNHLLQLYIQYETDEIHYRIERMQQAVAQDSTLSATLQEPTSELAQKFASIPTQASRWRLYVPTFHWYGCNNQYHRWISRFVQGDFGLSYRDRRPVSRKIMEGVRWTVLINGMAILLAYIFSIPIGVYGALHYGDRKDQWLSLTLFALYSLPSFWVATMIQVFFTTSEYGMDWFPSLGTPEVPVDASLLESWWLHASHLFLPIFCITYGSLAFISRQVRASMHQVLQSDFVRTARAKGLPDKTVIWRHAFRNAVFPLITLFAGVFPAALAGSVIIEFIFNIPGMGKLTIDAINGQDWPIVYTILMLAGVLTIMGILFSDILYKLADPRVDYEKRS